MVLLHARMQRRFVLHGNHNNLPERLQEHARAKDSEYTAKRLPVRLVWKQAYSSQQEAHKREREIKGWSRRKKLELIRKVQGKSFA